jgi:putative phage-type endonuclease
MPELINVTPGSPEWAAARRQGITVTDIPVILGISPWDSAWALYHRKLQLIPDVRCTEAMRLGTELEPYVVALWGVENDREVILPGALYRSTDRPWQMATIDREIAEYEVERETNGTEITGTKAVLEVKTVAAWQDWGDTGTAEIPPHVRAQLLWQMDVMSVSRGHVGALNRVSGEFRHYTIEHAEFTSGGPTDCQVCTDLDLMRSCGQTFMTRLKNGVVPDVDESAATLAALKALHPESRNDKRATIEHELWNDYLEASAIVGSGEAAKRGYEARIRDLIGEAGVIESDGKVVAYRRIQHVKAHTRKAGTRDMIVRASVKETTDE